MSTTAPHPAASPLADADPAAIIQATAAYNAEWLETATPDEQAEFMRFLADGVPTRMVIVDRYTGRGGAYRVIVTHGLCLDGSMAAAEDPAVGRVYSVVRRQQVVVSNVDAAARKYGRDVPVGVELVVKVR